MMNDNEVLTNENEVLNNNAYAELAGSALNYFQEHPIMLFGIGLSAFATCVIMSTCLAIDNKNKGVN